VSALLRLVALALALVCARGAQAALTPSAYRQVEVAPPDGARLPADVSLIDDTGRRAPLAALAGGKPTVLVFADYTCRTLCGPVLAFAANALAKAGLRPGADFRLLVVGLDPKDGAAAAQAMRRTALDGLPRIDAAATFLTADAATVAALTEAAGYRFAYDEANDQFAHPAAAFVLAGDLRIARVLSGLGLTPETMRLALVEAGEGRVGTFKDRVRLLCYGFDPAAGTYNVAVRRVLAITGVLTITALGGGIGLLVLAGPRRRV
jgi:protein SCO1/2